MVPYGNTKLVLKTVAAHDGQLHTVQEVANHVPGLTLDEVENELSGLCIEGLIDPMGQTMWPDGRFEVEGPFWINDDRTGPLYRGGVL